MPASLQRLRASLRMAIGLQWRAARRESFEVVALQVADSIALALQLWSAQRILVHLSGSASVRFADFVPALAALSVCYAARAVLGALVRERREIVAELLQRDVNLRVLETAARVDVETFEDSEFHDRLQRVRGSTYSQLWSLVWAVVNLTTQVLITISMVVVLIAVSPLTLLVCLLGVVPFLWETRQRNKLNYGLTVAQATRERERSYLEGLIVSRPAVPELRSLHLGDHLLGRMRRLYELRIADARRWSDERLRVSIVGGVLSSIFAALALGVLLWLSVRDGIDLSRLGVAVLALQQLISQLRGAAGVIGEIDAALPFLEDFRAFESRSLRPAAPIEGGDSLPPLETLRFDGLSFTYPGTARTVLRDVSSTIRAGEVVAIVGHNGSGKTTLAKLLCGLYQPTSGRVLWNGLDRAAYDHDAVRRSIGMVFQDFVRYELPVSDNVGFGDVDRLAERDGIAAALRAAGATAFVDQFVHGIDTRLSRSYAEGAEPSGGQWQRLALARAFFRDAPVLILDEPSSALDPVAERALFDDLRTVAAGRTVVVISHRFSTVRTADRILVMDQGALVEEGDHDTLMALGGRYAALFTLQASPYVG